MGDSLHDRRIAVGHRRQDRIQLCQLVVEIDPRFAQTFQQGAHFAAHLIQRFFQQKAPVNGDAAAVWHAMGR